LLGFHAPNHVCGKCKWKIHVEKGRRKIHTKKYKNHLLFKPFGEGKKERKKEFSP
jgi:hypothetical protein